LETFWDGEHDEPHPAQPTPDHTLRDVLSGFLDTLGASTRGSMIEGLPTGFPDLDAIFGGPQRGRLYVLGGATQTGKSSLVFAMARNLARGGTSEP